jgi:pseudouridine-5'-phosphate glycosidase/pseudouridine kinase
MRAAYSTRQSLKTTALRLSDEVEAAIQSNIPIVALETTIYTHGFPYPDNVALALNLESVVRRNGAIPATIGVLNGVARVGLSSEEITTLASSAGKPETMKVSRRDLPYILGMVCHFIPTVFETRFHTSF